MDLTAKKKLEKQISEGLHPVCPDCGSKLVIEKQDGTTGSRGYTYACSREIDTGCSLRSGTAYVPWYHVVWQAAQQKVTQVVLLILGSVTVAGLAGTSFGFVQFGNAATTVEQPIRPELPKETNDSGPLLVADTRQTDSLQAIVRRQQSQIDSLEKRPTGVSAAEEELIWHGKLSRGLHTADREKSKEYLMEVIDAYQTGTGLLQLPDDQKNEIMEVLIVSIAEERFSVEELKTYANTYVPDFSLRGRKNNHLAIAYFHLGRQDRAQRTAHWRNSLLHYLRYISYLMDNSGNALEQKRVLPDMERIVTRLNARSELPRAWKKDAVQRIERAVDKEDRQYIEQLVVELEANSTSPITSG